jgi:hypothetical protein
MSSLEKEKHMVDWWEANYKLFIQLQLKKIYFADMVLDSRLLFKFGISELLKTMSILNMELIIVSGGLKDIIDATFYSILHNGEITDR